MYPLWKPRSRGDFPPCMKLPAPFCVYCPFPRDSRYAQSPYGTAASNHGYLSSPSNADHSRLAEARLAEASVFAGAARHAVEDKGMYGTAGSASGSLHSPIKQSNQHATPVSAKREVAHAGECV